MIELIKTLKIAFILLLLMSVLTGFIYPIFITGMCQWFFPWQANGSLITNDGNVIGSILIGQSFSDPRYFWSRPSATKPFPYNATSSGGSNAGPSNPEYLGEIALRVQQLQKLSHTVTLIPVDLITASGSGLDPDISIAAAKYQIPRIAFTRQLSAEVIHDLIKTIAKHRTLGFLGENRINVLELNLALDQLTKGS